MADLITCPECNGSRTAKMQSLPGFTLRCSRCDGWGTVLDHSADEVLFARCNAGGTQIYIRFGDIPESGCSYNHKDDHPEAGVSVYAAWLLPGNTVAIDLRGQDSLSAMFIISNRPACQVTGIVVATGSDGEPILEGCKVLNPLTDVNWLYITGQR